MQAIATVEPNGKPIRSARKRNLALAAAFESWIKVKGYSPHTIRAYNRVVSDFLDFIKSDDVTGIDHTAIRQYLSYLHSRGCSPSTLAREVYALRAFFDSLNLAGVMNFFPARMIKNRRVPKKLPHSLSEEEVTRLIEASHNLRDRALLETFYATGCRVAELAQLRVEDIDFRQRTMRVMGKGQKERIVPFGRPAAAALKEHIKCRREGAVFQNQQGKPIDPRNLYRIVKSTGLRAGLRNIHPHLLRHTCATHMLDHGADIRYIQELLGHSSVSTTQIYTHVSMAGLSKAIEQFHPRARLRT